MLTSLKHTIRLARVGYVLARHDALFGLEAANISPSLLFILRLLKTRRRSSRGKRLAKALEALGPTFIKLGQTLSTRADLIGEDVAHDLAYMRDKLPPFSSKTAQKIIQQELGKPAHEVFASFENKPVAAASVAQVHFATTHDGKEVAVKILRPNIEARFAKDTEFFFWLARTAEKRLPHTRRLKPVAMVQTLADTITCELDFRYEAAAAEELKKNMSRDAGIYVPNVFWDTTSQRVLTTERIHGIPLSDLDAVKAASADTKKLAEQAARIFFQQVFRDGYFHADPHPGNIFLMDDGRFGVVDFGIMGRIDQRTKLFLAEILSGFLRGDYMRVAKVHFEHGIVPKHHSQEQFAQACMAIGKPILGKPLQEISVGKLLGQLFHMSKSFDMELLPELLLLQKTMMQTEGVGRELCPEVNMWQLAEPLITDWARKNFSFKSRLRSVISDVANIIQKAPTVLRDLEALITRLHDEKKAA